jgi:hypothetical protein
MAVLLVTRETEFLIGHPQPTQDFDRAGYDSLLGRDVWTRPRRFSPDLLATFPAVGAGPTIVVGSSETTGRSSTAWVLTVLHEHFHQWQYSRPDYYDGVARLDLARGDTTGRWMLDYPFPYDSVPVQRAMRRLALALSRMMARPANSNTLSRVTEARDELRQSLGAADYRYLEFQLWQEGVARYIEYAVAQAAAESGAPSAEFRTLPGYMPYARFAGQARRNLARELNQLSLGRMRRISFYPIGAAIALLLDAARCDWKQAYMAQPFALTTLLP